MPPFYSLTLTPEDKLRIHKEVFELAYHGNGFDHDIVYSMPVAMRYLNLKLLIEQKEKEREEINKPQEGITQKSPPRPFVKKPF